MVIDRNIVQYVLYDTFRKRKIFFNSEGQPVTRVEESPPNGLFGYQYNASSTEDYPAMFKKLQAQIGENRFREQEGLVLEQIPMIDPRIKIDPNFRYEQHDITKVLPEELPEADFIRIANLLPYFKKNKALQRQIIANLLAKLKPGGIIVLNLDEFMQEEKVSTTKYVFVLEKNNNQVTITPYIPPEHHKKSQRKKIWEALFDKQIRDISRIIKNLGFELQMEGVHISLSVEKLISRAA
jgi:hypothetical protein